MSLALQKKRMVTMFVVTGLCLVLAVAAFVGSIRLDNSLLLAAFFILLTAGFGAQIWFVLGFIKRGRAE